MVGPVMLHLNQLQVAPTLGCERSRVPVEAARTGEHITRFDRTEPFGIELNEIRVGCAGDFKSQGREVCGSLGNPGRLRVLVVLDMIAVVGYCSCLGRSGER